LMSSFNVTDFNHYVKIALYDQSFYGRNGKLGDHFVLVLQFYALVLRYFISRYAQLWLFYMFRTFLENCADPYTEKFIRIHGISLEFYAQAGKAIINIIFYFCIVTLLPTFGTYYRMYFMPNFLLYINRNHQSALQLTFLIISSHFNWLIRAYTFAMALHLDCSAYFLTIVVGYALIQSFRNSLNRLKKFLKKQRLGKILIVFRQQNTRNIEKYLHTDNHLLWHVLSLNNLVGKVVTALIVSMLPTSVWLVIVIFQNIDENYIIFLCYSMMFALFCVIGFFHWFLALFIGIVRRPTSLLIQLMFYKNFKLSSKMRIVKKIQQIHSDVRLGFTYASFGLISVSSFGKFAILYAKLLMIGYKHLKPSPSPDNF